VKKEQKEMTQEQGLVASIREDGWARVVTERRDHQWLSIRFAEWW
jgi:hypothetical protein